MARWVVHGRGLAGVATLEALLNDAELLTPQQAKAAAARATASAQPSSTVCADAVLAWGRKPSAVAAEAWAQRHGLPVLRLEDGFLRSVGLGPDEPPRSIVLDDLGIYYDAHQPSRLETLIAAGVDAVQTARAQALRRAWCAGRVSKYNHAREAQDVDWAGAVLVVDQTWGDASIRCGAAGPQDFIRMLNAALAEHPQRRVLLKVHPDVVAGRKRGHFDPALASLTPADRARVRWLGQDVHPPALLSQVAAVYVVTSQMGFEALLWGLPVRCFGLPFYAGWGLTQDEQPAPARRGTASLAALVHAALVVYPRYVHPETGQRCEAEALLDWMALQRRQRERFAPVVHAVGFSWWKRPIVRRFLAGSQVKFISPGAALPSQSTLAVWGLRPLPDGAQQHPPAQVIRLEDGFLRSVGLGADLVQPLSWVLDGQGLYYAASAPSALEQLLAQAEFPLELLARARALRQRILALGLTKYNVGQAGSWQRPATQRPVVLVAGQVESDAAIRHGAPQVRTNMGLLQAVRAHRPDAHLIYKPHPDVVARLRDSGQDEQHARQWCDEIVVNSRMDELLNLVDEVHVITSLAGFEALLRGKPVHTWGQPFYAGWGLTQDHCPQPDRRGRLLELDALTAAVLILYPTYVSRHTGHFTTPERALDELVAWRHQASRRGLGDLGRQLLRLGLRAVILLRRTMNR